MWQEPGAKVSVKVIVSKLFTYKDLLTFCLVLEAINYLFDLKKTLQF